MVYIMSDIFVKTSLNLSLSETFKGGPQPWSSLVQSRVATAHWCDSACALLKTAVDVIITVILCSSNRLNVWILLRKIFHL